MSPSKDLDGPALTSPPSPPHTTPTQASPIKRPRTIYDLPLEVLSMIFLECMDLPDTHHPRFDKTILTLGEVCKAWRMVAQSTAALWNHIVVSYPKAPDLDKSENDKECRSDRRDLEEWMELQKSFGRFIQHCVDHSGTLPLHLYLGTQEPAYLDAEKHGIFDEVLRPLLENTERWHRISGSVEYLSRTFRLLLLATKPFPELRQIQVEVQAEDEAEMIEMESGSTRNIRGIFHAPKLEIIQGCILPHFYSILTVLPSWTRLTRLQSLSCTPHQAALVLAHCQDLAVATFFGYDVSLDPQSEPSADTSVTLDGLYENRSLIELHLFNLEPKKLNPVLDRFHFPALQILGFCNMGCDHSAERSCNLEPYNIIRRCASTLKILMLERACITKDHLLQYLQHLNPTLEVLHINYQDFQCLQQYRFGLFDNEVLAQMTPTRRNIDGDNEHSQETEILPRLEELLCFFPNENGGSVDESALVKFRTAIRRHLSAWWCVY
ncbi:hypothetical protein MD484_g7684, partial [Candolleomyces efflorescens]